MTANLNPDTHTHTDDFANVNKSRTDLELENLSTIRTHAEMISKQYNSMIYFFIINKPY